MEPDGPDMLLTIDGKLAYVGVNKFGRFYVEHGGIKGGLLSEHDTLGAALLAAAKEIGAVP